MCHEYVQILPRRRIRGDRDRIRPDRRWHCGCHHHSGRNGGHVTERDLYQRIDGAEITTAACSLTRGGRRPRPQDRILAVLTPLRLGLSRRPPPNSHDSEEKLL